MTRATYPSVSGRAKAPLALRMDRQTSLGDRGVILIVSFVTTHHTHQAVAGRGKRILLIRPLVLGTEMLVCLTTKCPLLRWLQF